MNVIYGPFYDKILFLFLSEILGPKYSERHKSANTVDPDQTAPLEAVWSGSTLFAISSICTKFKFLSRIQHQYSLQTWKECTKADSTNYYCLTTGKAISVLIYTAAGQGGQAIVFDHTKESLKNTLRYRKSSISYKKEN